MDNNIIQQCTCQSFLLLMKEVVKALDGRDKSELAERNGGSERRRRHGAKTAILVAERQWVTPPSVRPERFVYERKIQKWQVAWHHSMRHCMHLTSATASPPLSRSLPGHRPMNSAGGLCFGALFSTLTTPGFASVQRRGPMLVMSRGGLYAARTETLLFTLCVHILN